MQESDRQPTDDHEIPETEERAELRRAAHKIAWTRMNGSIGAANPFTEEAANFAPGDGGHENGPSPAQ
jgi:hypothetical protein